MTTQPALSICTTVKNRSRVTVGDRSLELVPNLVRSLVVARRRFERIYPTGFELVIADFGSTDWPLAEWLPNVAGGLPYQLLDISGDFSRGRGLNATFAAARAAVRLTLDCDLVVRSGDVLIQGMNHVLNGTAWFPVISQETEDGQEIPLDGLGTTFLTKNMQDAIGPYPEFYSWGGDDNVYCARCQRQFPVNREYTDQICHQWHPANLRHIHAARPALADYQQHVARKHEP